MISREFSKTCEDILRTLFQAKLPEGARVFLYGSRARGDAAWNADYDFWIDCTVDRQIVQEIEEALEDSVVPFKIDMVTTDQLKGRFGEEVRKEARLWM